MLPFWQENEELPEHCSPVQGYHTEPCLGFRSGHCASHGLPGRKGASQCFNYHVEAQRRRPPVDAATGQLRYWDVPCPTASRGDPATDCPRGQDCPYAHSREEISYHAAKYKTRLCNVKNCRGEAVCCFAHSEAEIRRSAQERYSYWCLVSPGAQSAGPEWPGSGGELAGFETPLLAQPCASVYHPSRYKHRFCASCPDVDRCRRGSACAFAHSREEIRTPLLTLEEEQHQPSALTEEFFMHKFKTLWCPIGVQHDWQTCVYAHNYQDARRKVFIGYGPRPCPYWNKKDTGSEYSQRCPLGLRCPFSHGAKEQLYHPGYFRSIICRDLRNGECPRGELCAFYHAKKGRRRPTGSALDYQGPLPKDALPEEWVQDFLQPPFTADMAEGGDFAGGSGPCHAAMPSPLAMCPTARTQGALWGARFAPDTAWAKDHQGGNASGETTSASSHDEEGDSDEVLGPFGSGLQPWGAENPYALGGEAGGWPGAWSGLGGAEHFGGPWWGMAMGGSQWWGPEA